MLYRFGGGFILIFRKENSTVDRTLSWKSFKAEVQREIRRYSPVSQSCPRGPALTDIENERPETKTIYTGPWTWTNCPSIRTWMLAWSSKTSRAFVSPSRK